MTIRIRNSSTRPGIDLIIIIIIIYYYLLAYQLITHNILFKHIIFANLSRALESITLTAGPQCVYRCLLHALLRLD
jgi:hypothetical protein